MSPASSESSGEALHVRNAVGTVCLHPGPLGALLGGSMAPGVGGTLSTEGKACGRHGALTTREGLRRPGLRSCCSVPRVDWTAFCWHPGPARQESPVSTEAAEPSWPLLHFPDGGIPPQRSGPGNGGQGRGPWRKGPATQAALILPSAPRRPLTRRGHQQTLQWPLGRPSAASSTRRPRTLQRPPDPLGLTGQWSEPSWACSPAWNACTR